MEDTAAAKGADRFRVWEKARERAEASEAVVDRTEAHTAFACRSRAAEGAVDGRRGTWVRRGWAGDAVQHDRPTIGRPAGAADSLSNLGRQPAGSEGTGVGREGNALQASHLSGLQ